MATTRRTTKPPTEAPRPPGLTMSRKEAEAKIADRLEKAAAVRSRFGAPDGPSAKGEYEGWHQYNVEMLRRMFTDPSISEEYRYCGPAPTGDDREKPRDADRRVRDVPREVQCLR